MATIDPDLDRLAKDIDLPPRIFLYTLEQIAVCIGLPPETLRRKYVYFHGRTSGDRRANLLVARNIAGPESKPEWRVAENELVRWMRRKGFVFVMSSKVKL